MIKIKKLLIIINILVVLFLAVIVYSVDSEDLINGVATVITKSEHKLAPIFNEESLDYDRVYAENYLELHNNFSEIKYQRIWGDKEDFTLNIGNKPGNLQGIRTKNNEKFAIDLVYCDEYKKICKFRINGVITPELSVSNNLFIFDEDYILKLNSVEFNKCNNHRFCNFGYEGYHQVDISVEVK